jgi:hypothetical protein
MKKLFVIFVVSICSTVMNVNAQAPDSIRTSFNRTYPNVNATWKNENGNYNAYFNDERNQQRVIGYDKAGTILYNRTQINSTDVPAGISSYYGTKYPNQTNYSVWMEDNNGKRSYYTIQDNSRLYFDNNGNYVRTAPIDRSDPMYNFNEIK